MNLSPLRRCRLLIAAAALALGPQPADSQALRTAPAMPIIFVHGNGDHAGLWDATIWRFESNGYPADRLFAVDLPHPLAQANVRVAEENRSSPEDQTAALAAFVTRVLLKTGASKVALVGSSRGGMTIRNYVRFGGGAAHVSHVITCGSPNHGVFANPAFQPLNEFNGAGEYLRTLNAGREVVAGVRYLTLRSDSADKYAQSDGAALGTPGVPTNVDARGPALRGAVDVVLSGADHRETAFSAQAFAAQYRFLTGRTPARLTVTPDSVAVLGGLISGVGNGSPTNLPMPGASIRVYEVDRESGRRLGGAAHAQTVGVDGRWGPFRARPDATYEFEVVPSDSAVILDFFRAPLPRSTSLVNFRVPASVTRSDSTTVLIVRPRGYLGARRDTVQFDGEPARGIPAGVPSIDRVSKRYGGPDRSVTTRLNGERIVVRTSPGDARRVVIAEFTGL